MKILNCIKNCFKKKTIVNKPIKLKIKNTFRKRYVLVKALPGIHRGAIFQQSYLSDNIYFYAIPISSNIPEKDQVGIIEFEAKYVENNPLWFQNEEIYNTEQLLTDTDLFHG